MRYGKAVKDSVIKRVLPPDAESIRTVSLDTGISDQAIRNWLAKFNPGIIKARLTNPERWRSRSVRQRISEDTVVLNPNKKRDSSKVRAKKKSS